MKTGPSKSMIQPMGFRGCLRASTNPSTAKGSTSTGGLPVFETFANGTHAANMSSVKTPTTSAVRGPAHRKRTRKPSRSPSDCEATAPPPLAPT